MRIVTYTLKETSGAGKAKTVGQSEVQQKDTGNEWLSRGSRYCRQFERLERLYVSQHHDRLSDNQNRTWAALQSLPKSAQTTQ